MRSFKELAINRYSCRNYKNSSLTTEIITDLFEICKYSPSASNNQPWEFIVVNDIELLQKLRNSYTRSWFKSAQTVIIAIANKNIAWTRSDGKNHADTDLAIFIDHLTLAATDMGLATCWICDFDEKLVIKEFMIPDGKYPVALIPIGYPEDEVKKEKKRKQIKEFLFFNHYPND